MKQTQLRRTQLKRIRLALGLTQAELAKMAGIDRQTVFYLEAGSSFPRPASIPRLAKAYGVTPQRFVELLYIDTYAPLKELLEKLAQAGGNVERVVVLAEDQSLANCPFDGCQDYSGLAYEIQAAKKIAWKRCQDEMLAAGWRKMKQG